MTVPTTSWDETSPAGSQDISLGDNRIRELKTQIREVVDVDHKFDSSGQDADMGKHNKVSFLEAADIGTGATGKPILGAQTVSGKAELVFTDEDDNDVQITSAGKLVFNYALADGKIIVGSAGGAAAAVDMSGDATIANTGAVTIANNAIETAMIGDDQVTPAKLEGIVGAPGTYHVSATNTQVTASTSYTDMSDMTITFTPESASNPIAILFSCWATHNTSAGSIAVILDIGGNVAETERKDSVGGNGDECSVSFHYYTTLAASSQTVKVQVKTELGSLTVQDRALTVIEFKQN